MESYLLIVESNCSDPKHEKEFNEWYNKEHIPALLKVSGVLGASRYTSLEGTPKYTAIYELDRFNVTTSEAWKKAIEMTPRPKDVTPKNVTRSLCERIFPK